MKKTKFKMTGNGSRIEEVSESSCLCASVLKKDAGTVEGGFNTETQRRRGTEFKMTEIGLIPEDWEVKRLGEMFELSAAGDLQFECSSREKTDLNIYPIYSNSIENAGMYGFTSNPRYSADSITITGRGTLGHAEYRAVDFDAIIRLIIMKPLRMVDGRYVTFQINYCSPFHFEITSIPQLTVPQVANSLIPVPPLAEQKKIAEALSDVDELLAAMTTLIEKKRAIKQGAMQELLTGKKRLPGFGGKWIGKRLGDCALIKARIGWQGLTTDEYLENGPYYLITGSDFRDGKVNWSQCYYVDKNRYEQDKNIQIQKNDVLVSKDGTIGKVAFLDEIPAEGTLNSGVFVIRTRDKEIEQLYMAWVFLSKWFDDFINRLVAGSTIVHLYQKDIVGFEFPVPPTIAEQKAIAEVLSDMDAEISELEAQKAKFESIKQGMMQELLTGKTRLKGA